MRDLDNDIREAFEALDATAPSAPAGDRDAYFANYFETLASRVDARLETEQMTAPRKAPRAARDADGDDLQADIRSLAKATKQRVSQKRRAASEAEQSLLLSASSTGLRAVALPPPGVDDWHFEDLEDEVAAARDKRSGSARAAKSPARAGADADERVEDEDDRGGLPVWIYAAVGTVAVAAVVFFLVRGGEKPLPSASDRVAMTEQPEPAGDRASSGVASGGDDRPAEPAASATGVDGEGADPAAMVGEDPSGPGGDQAGDSTSGGAGADDGSANGPSDGDDGARSGTRRGRDAVAMTRPGSVAKPRARGRAAAERGAGRGGADSTSNKPAEDPGPAPAAAKKPTPPPPPRKAGDHSIDELLREASGGAAEPTKGDATPKPAAAPAKKELDRDDIKKAMDAVQGKVSGCKDKLAEPGMVMVAVRFKVSPGGQVTSASASGKHSGTPVGDCVAGAVKTARFPVISGPPSSLSYSFLLSQ